MEIVNVETMETESIKEKTEKTKSLNYTHTFRQPALIRGEKVKTLNFLFEELTGEDLELAEMEVQDRGIVVITAETSSPLLIALAARAANVPADDLSRLPLGEYTKIKNAVRDFLVQTGY